MGKVASSSVSRAILAAGLACHDIHSLAPDYLKKTASEWLRRGEYPPPHICVSMAHRDRLILKKKQCLYISLVRDPLSRNLSAFFQNLHLQKTEIRNETDAKRMFGKFLENYGHSIPLTWFNREFKAQLGLDVFSGKFETEERYSYYEPWNMVIFRVDCPDDTKSEVLSRLLNANITVARVNDSDSKEYHELYSGVKEHAVFDPEFMSKMYNSKFAAHFWTKDERTKMAARWVDPDMNQSSQSIFGVTKNVSSSGKGGRQRYRGRR